MPTRSEQDVYRFLTAGHRISEPELHRVGYFRRAQNIKWSKSKAIDIIGFLKDGIGFAIEVKERQTGTRFPFTIFDKERCNGIDQTGHLQFIHDCGATALIWFQEICDPDRRGTDHATLFTWDEWLALKADPPLRFIKKSKEYMPYASVHLNDIVARFPWTEMTWHQGLWWSPFEVVMDYAVFPLLKERKVWTAK